MRLVLDGFGGMAPRLADRLLAETQASHAANVRATSGNLKGFGSLAKLTDLPAGEWGRAVRLYRPNVDPGDPLDPDPASFVWWLHPDRDADALVSPLVNDAHGRVYYSAPSHDPRLTTLDLIEADPAEPDYVALGVARPTTAPTLGQTGGVSGTMETRAYAYAWQTDYGEISAPSPAELITVPIDVTSVSVAPPLSAPSVATSILIYRSATTDSNAVFYQVGEIAVGVASFDDGMSGSILALQPRLESSDYDPPVAGLRGLVQHSSGALAGFKGRDVHFSRPWLPHAWPGSWKYSVADDIVGLAPLLNGIVVLTVGRPVTLVGATPEAMSITTFPEREPCVAKRSIVPVSGAVLYASPNGLMAIDLEGIANVTAKIASRHEWADYWSTAMTAARYGSWYVAYVNDSTGYTLSLPPDETPALVWLDRLGGVQGIDADRRNGQLHVLQDGRVSLFDASDDARFACTWRSKEYVLPKPVNLGATQCLFRAPVPEPAALQRQAEALSWNTARFAAGPLDPLGFSVLGSPTPLQDDPPAPPGSIQPPPGAPLGGEPLYNVAAMIGALYVRMTLIGDGQVRWSGVLRDGLIRRLPSGYKATAWYVELASNAEVQRVVVAETGKECALA